MAQHESGLKRESSRAPSQSLNADMSLRTLGEAESNNDTQVETILESSAQTPTRESSIPVSPANSSEGRKRTTPKIANLKATFEGLLADGASSAPSSPGRFEKRCREQDIAARDKEIAKLKEQLDSEVEKKQELKEKCVEMEEEIKTLTARLQRQDGEWRKDMARQSRKLMAERAQSKVEFMDIKRQLLDLKKSISMATRTDNQLTDSS